MENEKNVSLKINSETPGGDEIDQLLEPKKKPQPQFFQNKVKNLLKSYGNKKMERSGAFAVIVGLLVGLANVLFAFVPKWFNDKGRAEVLGFGTLVAVFAGFVAGFLVYRFSKSELQFKSENEITEFVKEKILGDLLKELPQISETDFEAYFNIGKKNFIPAMLEPLQKSKEFLELQSELCELVQETIEFKPVAATETTSLVT